MCICMSICVCIMRVCVMCVCMSWYVLVTSGMIGPFAFYEYMTSQTLSSAISVPPHPKAKAKTHIMVTT